MSFHEVFLIEPARLSVAMAVDSPSIARATTTASRARGRGRSPSRAPHAGADRNLAQIVARLPVGERLGLVRYEQWQPSGPLPMAGAFGELRVVVGLVGDEARVLRDTAGLLA